jgi:hypothetical protein
VNEENHRSENEAEHSEGDAKPEYLEIDGEEKGEISHQKPRAENWYAFTGLPKWSVLHQFFHRTILPPANFSTKQGPAYRSLPR